jgi:hypothetical protein
MSKKDFNFGLLLAKVDVSGGERQYAYSEFSQTCSTIPEDAVCPDVTS